MRIARYVSDGAPEVGVVVRNDRVVSVRDLGENAQVDVISILEAGAGEWQRLARLAEEAEGTALDEVRLLAPIDGPSKFLAVGMNSDDHLREMKEAPRSPELLAVLEASQHLKAAFPEPRFPVIFNKQTTSVTGPRDPIWLPHDSQQVDYEGEVAVVIGCRLRRADVSAAQSAIAGYTVTNDVSVRDWQWNTSQIWLGKSFDTHGPIGPWIVTADEFDPGSAIIRTWVNDDLRQEGGLADQNLSPAEIVSLISTVCTLEPGDLIATGTPGGIGGITGRYLVAGDHVRVAISGIGEISNQVIDEPVPGQERPAATSGVAG